MRKYRLVAKKGEGTFSEVLKAQNVKDGRYHAIKCMKNRFESIDQVNNLREIQALRRLSPHDNIITLEEVLYDQPTGRLALVFELMDANLYELIRGRRHYLNPNLIKSYMWQLMKSLDHMHRKGIFHRDIKPENILIESSSEVSRGLKLADFGSCRGIYSKQPYTEYISTRWYRAPECLLTDGYYGPEMDMWGAGCVMFEITSLYPLFPGSNEVDQINRIHKVLSTPSPEVLNKLKSKGASHISFDFPPQKGIGIPQLVPHAAPEAIDLMVKLIKYDASERISARECMRHPYFRDMREAEQRRNSQNESQIKSDMSNVANANANASDAAQKPVKPSKSDTFASAGQGEQGKNHPLPSIVGANEGSTSKSQLGYSTTDQSQNTLQAKNSTGNLSQTNALPPIAGSQQLQGSQAGGKVSSLAGPKISSLQGQGNSSNPSGIGIGVSQYGGNGQGQSQASQGVGKDKRRKKYKAPAVTSNAGGNGLGQQTIEASQGNKAFVPSTKAAAVAYNGLSDPKGGVGGGVQGRKSTKF